MVLPATPLASQKPWTHHSNSSGSSSSNRTTPFWSRIMNGYSVPAKIDHSPKLGISSSPAGGMSTAASLRRQPRWPGYYYVKTFWTLVAVLVWYFYSFSHFYQQRLEWLLLPIRIDEDQASSRPPASPKYPSPLPVLGGAPPTEPAAQLALLMDKNMSSMTSSSPLPLSTPILPPIALADLQASRRYVQSLTHRPPRSGRRSKLSSTMAKLAPRTLLFVHIPKTAGSTMEFAVASEQGNLSWGKCMMRKPHSAISTTPTEGTCPKYSKPRGRELPPLPSWHIPVHFFPAPYHGADLFAVARHPIERMISEYHYNCKHYPEKCSKDCDINCHFRQKLNASTSGSIRHYFQDGCHWIPQYDYAILQFKVPTERWRDPSPDAAAASEEQDTDDGISTVVSIRYMDHILDMDHNMGEEFDALAAAYGLPHLHWPTPGSKTNAGSYDRSTTTLEPDVLELLNRTFEKDWLLLQSSVWS